MAYVFLITLIYCSPSVNYVPFDTTSDSELPAASPCIYWVAAARLRQSLNNKHSTSVIADRLCSRFCQRSEIRICINAADSRKANMNNLQQRWMRVMTLMCALFSFSVLLTPCSPRRWKRPGLWLVCLLYYLKPLMHVVNFNNPNKDKREAQRSQRWLRLFSITTSNQVYLSNQPSDEGISRERTIWGRVTD